LYIAKAAGDDYSLGFLLGVPDCAPEAFLTQQNPTSVVPNNPNANVYGATSMGFS